MPIYTVPRQDFKLLLEAMGDRKTAETIAIALIVPAFANSAFVQLRGKLF